MCDQSEILFSKTQATFFQNYCENVYFFVIQMFFSLLILITFFSNKLISNERSPIPVNVNIRL